MTERPDLHRIIGDVVRIGRVVSVDAAAATCVVRVGELETGDVRWLAWRAGSTIGWSPPSVDEQVILLCPEGDTARAVVLLGFYSDHNPAPASRAGLDLVRFADGAELSYDREAHALALSLPAGATIEVTAPGGVTITASDGIKLIGPVTVDGDIDVTGKLTASDDVVAAGKSLKLHRHLGVQAGGAVSGPPQ